ncbi:MAG TPA: hypothetical protein VFN50_01240 [Acidimicrobiales bacterium]|nr:hypothetical protein [Acidimicrobiales bacterium]
MSTVFRTVGVADVDDGVVVEGAVDPDDPVLPPEGGEVVAPLVVFVLEGLEPQAAATPTVAASAPPTRIRARRRDVVTEGVLITPTLRPVDPGAPGSLDPNCPRRAPGGYFGPNSASAAA